MAQQEPVDLVPTRSGIHRATALDRESGGGLTERDRRSQTPSLSPSHGKCPIEDIPGSHGVDRTGGKTGDHGMDSLTRYEYPGRSHRDQHTPRTQFPETLRRTGRRAR